jgi:hypothetical protein|tara:strand:- start:439 stop:648 length:210 start_codon:yes stop_codon:yes gene_type:complete
MTRKYWKFESESTKETIPTDTFFEFTDTENLKGLVNQCALNDIDFEIYFEVFSEETQEILRKETVTENF